MSIPMLQSGELGIVTCDWKITGDGPQTLSVELDRTNQISESDESNNFESTVDAAKFTTEDSSSDVLISTSMLWIITLVVVALIIALFSAFAPGKIKKL